jgi:hypothetical protein
VQKTGTITGDVNGDGIVNGQDIATASANYLHVGAFGIGDVNHDGLVNGQDIALISSNYLATGGGASAFASEIDSGNSRQYGGAGAVDICPVLDGRDRGLSWAIDASKKGPVEFSCHRP